MKLIERIKQQLRIIDTAYLYFGVAPELTIEYADHSWRYVHDYTRTVLSVDCGMSDSTDTRFVNIRNHITGIGYLYTSVEDNEFAELEMYLEEQRQRRRV